MGAADLPDRAPAPRRRETARLVWNTKPKRPPSPRDLEFQPAEVVFPNKAATGQQELLIPRTPEGEVDDKQMNRLIWGDNLLAMQALLAQGYAGKIQLIYIDPPFLSAADYSHKILIEGAGQVEKPPSIIERLAYTDTWREGIDSYLDMLFPRLQAMRELLSDSGTIYVHIGPSVAPYVKVLLDEVFGANRLRNQIIWQRATSKSLTTGRLPSNHDLILCYQKGETAYWNANAAFLEYDEDDLDEKTASKYTHKDPDGRLYTLDNLINPNPDRPNLKYEFLGVTKVWRWTRERMQAAYDAGLVVQPSPGAVPRFKRYLDEQRGRPLGDVWTDIPPVNSQAREDTGFDTQKPRALLERIISMSSAPSDLVADFFHGSGTTAIVAEMSGRRWIATDLGKVGVQITRARLVEANAAPFVLENIGNYQRELIYREGGNIALMQRLVMRLYGAEPHPTHTDLGVIDQKGTKVLVYVGYPDRPLTARKTAEIVKTARTLDGAGYDRVILLAWDYEYNYDEQIEIRRKGFGVQIEPRLIPPSIYEYLRKSKDENDLLDKFKEKIKFGAKPYLKISTPEAKPKGEGQHNVSLAIDKYVLAEIPIDDEKQRNELLALTKGDRFAVLVDYWAVDWDYDGKTFRSRWQDFRGNGKSTRVVATRANTTLEGGRRYDIAVRVVDVFGNDATATTSIDLR